MRFRIARLSNKMLFWHAASTHAVFFVITGLHIKLLHAGIYLLKLQIDDMILGGCGQACPGMPKEAIRT